MFIGGITLAFAVGAGIAVNFIDISQAKQVKVCERAAGLGLVVGTALWFTTGKKAHGSNG